MGTDSEAANAACPVERRSLSQGRLAKADRTRRLQAAGYNVRNLDPADVELDLITDVPPWSAVNLTRQDGKPDLASAARAIFGPARFVATTHGRSAEYALATALAKKKEPAGFTVLSHGLFFTTERAFRKAGANIEIIPRQRPAGASDVDLDWLERRLKEGPVDAVCLEPSNNGLGGWPLQLDNVRAVSEICHRHGAMLVFDATRLLSNVAALGAAVVETAREFCGAADAFTVSCGKEFLVANGGLVAVRESDLERAVFDVGWNLGLLLEPVRLQWELFGGMLSTARDPSRFAERRVRLADLASRLGALGIPIVEPLGGHAVYVEVDGLMVAGQKHRDAALESLLYECGGVRAKIGYFPLLGKHLLRLTWPIAALVEASHLEVIARGLKAMFDGAPAAPLLAVDEKREARHPLFAAFRVDRSL
jgi:tryptophanase